MTRFTPSWPAGALVLAVCAVIPAQGLRPSAALAQPAAGQTTPPEAQAPRQVALYVFLLDLIEIDGSEQTFFADVMVVARWHDPALASPDGRRRTVPRGQVSAPAIVVVNDRDLSNGLPDVVNIDGDGNAQYSMRLMGDFAASMDLRRFPRDEQTFEVFLVAPPLGGQPFEIAPDQGTGVHASETLSISDWTLEPPELVAKEFQTAPGAATFKGVSLTFRAQRRVGYYLIQVLLPLTAVGLMAWAVFWIDSAIVTTRVGVVVTTMLTLIAYRFMLGNLVPRLSYLTLLDYFMLCITSMVLFTLFVMAGASFLNSMGREDIVARIDRTGRIVYPLLLAVVTVILWVV
jgi:hypothetical protein